MSIDLDAIEARIAAATPGPWTATYEDADRWTSITGEGYSIDGDLWVVCPEVATCEGELGPDADLIAHAPEDLAALVAEVRATTADLAVAVEVARERGEEIERLRAERRRSLAETHALLGRLSRTEAVADAAMGFYGEPGSEALDAALDALLRERAR